MKTFFFMIVCAVLAAPVFGADFGERIKTLEGLIAKNPAYAKSSVSVRLELLKMEKQPGSWTELKSTLADITKKQGITKTYVSAVAAYQAVLFDYNGKFVTEAFADARENHLIMAYHFIRRFKDKLGFTTAQLEQELLNIMTKAKLEKQVKTAAWIVDTYIKLLPNVEEAKAKEGLKKINRIFSPYLLKDKTAWEPIIASIRTALETY